MLIGFSALRAEAKARALKRGRPLFFNSTPERLRQKFWAEFHAAARDFELRVGFTRTDVDAAFRRLARKMHPDVGGTHEAFQSLVSQRDLLLSQATERRLESVPF